jgi:hypothetical protein
MTRPVHRLLTAIITLFALLLPAFPGTAHANDEACTTTSTLKTSRVWPGSRHIKMTYCSDGAAVRVTLYGKGISSNLTVFDDVSAEFRVRDRKGKVVAKVLRDLGDVNGRFDTVLGMQNWVDVEVLTFTLEQPPTGTYRLEGRLLVDWNGDGKGVYRTGFKRLTFSR